MSSDGTHCCEDMAHAFEWGFVERDPLDSDSIIFTRRKVSETMPQAKMGNVLTGETYDPSHFQMSIAFSYCPFCGKALTVDALYAELEEPDDET